MTTYQTPHLLACMGGWCSIRGRCPHYHAGRTDGQPSERLCLPGQDGVSDVASLKISPPVQRVIEIVELV